MVRFDAPVLKADPARIVAVPEERGDLAMLREMAISQPDPKAPACQAALAGYRTALMFRVLFTGLVFAVSLAAAAALIYSIAKIIKDGIDLGSAVTVVGGFVGSGAAIFLGKRMNESIKVAHGALEDVGTYCGVATKEQLK